MKKATKTALMVIGGVLVAFAMIVGGGVWWVKANWEGFEKGFEDLGEEVAAEVIPFAEEHEQKDCMEESRRRARACTLSFSCQVKAAAFFDLCLENAAPSEGLCDEVPNAREEAFEAGLWPEVHCRKLGRKNEFSCPGLFESLVDYCTEQASGGAAEEPELEP